MHLARVGFVVGVSSLLACSAPSAGSTTETGEEDLSTACAGDYKKVSELTDGSIAARLRDYRVVDYDGDGHLDVVAAQQGRADDRTQPYGRHTFELNVLKGDGHGHLAPPVTQVLHGHATRDFTFADLDGDGQADALYQSILDDYQQVLKNPDGTWGAPTSLGAMASCAFTRGGGFQTSLVVSDVNGDGKRDVRLSLVSADATGAEIGRVTMLGTPSGLGKATCEKVSSNDAFGGTWFELRHSRTADFDGDGKTDMVGFGDLRRMTFALDIASPAPVSKKIGVIHSNIAFQAVVGRFDLDAFDDVADLTPRDVQLYYGDATNPLTRMVSFDGLPRPIAAMNDGAAMTGDVNGDGKPDFVFFSKRMPVQAGQRVLPTVCSRSTGVHARYESRVPIDDAQVDLVGVGDFDEDKREDLLLVVRPQGSVFAPTVPGRFVIVKK